MVNCSLKQVRISFFSILLEVAHQIPAPKNEEVPTRLQWSPSVIGLTFQSHFACQRHLIYIKIGPFFPFLNKEV